MRFVLIANNPKAPTDRLRLGDATVQFNHCEHYDRIRTGTRIFVWRQNGGGTVSGWHGSDPAHEYNGALHVLLGRDPRIEYECERRNWPFRSITTQPPHYPNGTPSTGFWAAYILHRMGLDVALCGFTHGPFWPGHNWQHEREWCDRHRIVRL